MLLQRATLQARRVISLALLALLVSQFGALVHAVVHEPLLEGHPAHGRWTGQEQERQQEQAQQQAQAQAHEHAASEPATAPDDHSAGSPVCQLVDHLLFAHMPGGPGLQVLALDRPGSAPQHGPAHGAPARPTKAYEARGPPRA